jgi:transposase
MPDFDFNNEMSKNSELTESERCQIIGFHKAGFSRNDINKTLGFAKTTITRTIQNYRDGKSTKTAPRSGRPRSIDTKAEHELKQIVKKCKRASVPLLNEKFREKTGIQVSDRTLIKYLHKIGFHSCIPVAKPLLSSQQRENRLNWCLERKEWSVRKWANVIWSDESRFTIFKTDGPGRIWRTPGTRFNIENLIPSVKHGGGGLMVWGCFSGKGLGPLVKIEGKMDRLSYIKILEKHLLPYISTKFNEKGYMFQQDNAPVHTARDVGEWITTKKIKTLPDWPSQSPDLNPIEHLWSELERRIRNRSKHPKNIRELEIALQNEWAQIPEHVYIGLVKSMPRRVEACIAKNGWPTKY